MSERIEEGYEPEEEKELTKEEIKLLLLAWLELILELPKNKKILEDIHKKNGM